jgi:conjugative transfer region protein TrbK
MRGRLLDIPAFGRAAGFALVATAIIATTLHFDRQKAEREPPTARLKPSVDPLAVELARCQSIGIGAQNDVACAAAWAENRRRFFTNRPADSGARTTPQQLPLPRPEDR